MACPNGGVWHGSMIPLTRARYDALVAAFPEGDDM